MGNAKVRGPYERRKEQAMAKAEAAPSSFPTLKVGDQVTVQGQRLLVTGLSKHGFKGTVLPSEKK